MPSMRSMYNIESHYTCSWHYIFITRRKNERTQFCLSSALGPDRCSHVEFICNPIRLKALLNRSLSHWQTYYRDSKTTLFVPNETNIRSCVAPVHFSVLSEHTIPWFLFWAPITPFLTNTHWSRDLFNESDLQDKLRSEGTFCVYEGI